MKKGRGWGEGGREDKPNKSTRDAIIPPPGSSVTASKSENIRECPWLCPFNSIDLQNKVAEDRGELCGKNLGGEEVSEGRDTGTLGQSFWGQSSGGPHIFGSYLPHLRWAHVYFSSYRFRWQPKGGLASVSGGQGEGHPATPICRVHSILKGFPRI